VKPHRPAEDVFAQFARSAARVLGSAYVFCAAILIIVLWAAMGPIFRYSDTWQLVINTGTTIVTFLMVFVIQNTQNRDGIAVQLKLDELIRAIEGARNRLMNLENLSESDIKRIATEFDELHAKARKD
jgi:low affinity Fe/Cu permease